MASTVRSRWLIYALGGGLGHLTRAVALARAAGRQGHAAVILTNSPYAAHLPLAAELGPLHTVVALDPAWNRDRVADRVAQSLAQIPYDVLVVDTFPKGLGGELAAIVPRLRCPKVLVHRDLNPAYVEQGQLQSAIEHYDLILVPGEPAPFQDAPQAITTAPWLIRDADELLAPEDALRILHVDGDEQPVVVVLGCGRLDEIAKTRELAARLGEALAGSAAVRFITPVVSKAEQDGSISALQLWPVLPVLPAVAVLVGAGGYNTVHEARATGVPLVAQAQPRLYDRQRHRLRAAERADSPAAVVERVLQLMRSEVARRTAPQQHYENGVHAAVDAIMASGRHFRE